MLSNKDEVVLSFLLTSNDLVLLLLPALDDKLSLLVANSSVGIVSQRPDFKEKLSVLDPTPTALPDFEDTLSVLVTPPSCPRSVLSPVSKPDFDLRLLLVVDKMLCGERN